MLLVFRAVTGSPPHMRGKGGQTMAKRTGLGITPAHAGKSYRSAFPGTMFRDHPRTCGEKFFPQGLQIGGEGSPPHMRGKAGRARRGACPLRITPAHAGKRPGLALLLPRTGDHPRTCGEKSRAKMELSRNQGSPPHMRGKENRCGHAYQTYGITPAHAGKSRSGHFSYCSQQDHPRTCGEKTKKIP